MLVQFILIFLFLNCVSTYEEGKTNIEDDSHYDNIYQFWPYKYNTAVLMDIIKRDVNPPKAQVQAESNIENTGNEQQKVKQDPAQAFGQSEGGVVNQVPVANATPVLDVNQKLDLVTLNEKPEAAKDKSDIIKTDVIKSNSGNNDTKTNGTVAQPISKIEEAPVSHNDTSVEPSNMVDISKPGVVKRGIIVFGGLTLLAVAYFIFYRNKHKKFDAANAHGTGESNQFRYGVLHSDDRRENLELSRIPLTMESDDDDDEDLEIFDLEQKRKSLSYVSLQANDEDIVLRSSKDESKNNLLLDIEDGPADQLINWSSSGSKSIL